MMRTCLGHRFGVHVGNTVFLGSTPSAAAHPSQAMRPVALVRTFIATYNRQDVPATMVLFDPAFRHVSDRGSGIVHEETAVQFIQGPFSHVVAFKKPAPNPC
ncbi:MAG: hypothetical protein NVS2B7_36980 [Herpetosiphon sp.]